MTTNQEINGQVVREINDAINAGLRKIVISNKQNKAYEYRKVEITPVKVKGVSKYQVSSYTDKQVFQDNINIEETASRVAEIFPVELKQMNIFTESKEIALKGSKSGKLLRNTKILVAGPVVNAEKTAHNRQKNYILKEGTVIPPLVDMGVFTKEGKVVASMYDKFKQINRFIELVDDVLKNHTKDAINIVDFGCGKSYLTFILYYYLVEIKGKKANIVGLDLKEDVIKKCNATAKKYGYHNLQFKLGDINGYSSDMPVDMVVTLHACDTATDYALYNAVQWNATYIMSVPCCQHEVNKTISSDTLAPMMKYGIIKERTAALATDALRGAMLEHCGYKTQLLEFVDLAHSPKNILIRAVKANVSKEKKAKSLEEARKMCGFLGVEPTILKLLG